MNLLSRERFYSETYRIGANISAALGLVVDVVGEKVRLGLIEFAFELL